jgi:hypothetical protein
MTSVDGDDAEDVNNSANDPRAFLEIWYVFAVGLTEI